MKVAAFLLVTIIANILVRPGCLLGQDSGQVDLLFPQFAHPREDALASIKRGDLRFLCLDSQGKDVPGTEDYPRLVKIHETKLLKQPFGPFPRPSTTFSFKLRARAYANDYNYTLLCYLLQRHDRK